MEPGYMERKAALLPEGVDPRLDNRTGSDRPPVESDPAVPQQVDGPDLMHQAEHAEAVARKAAAVEDVERKGMFSPGDHSLGSQEERRGNDMGQADPRLETDPENPNSASTDVAEGDVVPAADALQAAEVAKNVRQVQGGADSETATAGPGERRARSTRSAPAADKKE